MSSLNWFSCLQANVNDHSFTEIVVKQQWGKGRGGEKEWRMNRKTQEEHRKSSLASPVFCSWFCGFCVQYNTRKQKSGAKFHHSSASVYYTERKPKNEEQKLRGLGTRLLCPQAHLRALSHLHKFSYVPCQQYSLGVDESHLSLLNSWPCDLVVTF